uniref:Inner membrane protein n=1 Tax=Heterorhabditis bacteriophora TaxID=37862 RepID=A0A1I7XMG8_HETBA
MYSYKRKDISQSQYTVANSKIGEIEWLQLGEPERRIINLLLPIAIIRHTINMIIVTILIFVGMTYALNDYSVSCRSVQCNKNSSCEIVDGEANYAFYKR